MPRGPLERGGEPASLPGGVASASAAAPLRGSPESPLAAGDELAALNKRSRLCGLAVPMDNFSEERRSAHSRQECASLNKINAAVIKGDWKCLHETLLRLPDLDIDHSALCRLVAHCDVESDWQSMALLLQRSRQRQVPLDLNRSALDAAQRLAFLGPHASSAKLAQQNCCFWLQQSYVFCSHDASTPDPTPQATSPGNPDPDVLTRIVDTDNLLGLVCAALQRCDGRLGDSPTTFLVPTAKLPRRGKNWNDSADMSTVKLTRKNAARATITPVNCLPGGPNSPSLHPKYRGMERQLVNAALNHRAASLMEYAVMIGAEKCAQFLIELQARRLCL